ncbi:MCP four helix bundle domain-containing protein, partial [Oryzifoliimicrobium ureilyticus]|uniref:MCP four helix bundle domain-containing protein n=1 Tax=Oryzifoliimicrobium ureilyticus TaxID=3113724 RepID=UPI0030761106
MKLSISHILGGMSVLMITVAAAQGLFAVHSFSSLSENVETVVDHRVPSFVLLGQLNADLGDVRIDQSGIVYAEASETAKFDQKLSEVVTRIDANIDKLQALLVDEADKR